MNKRWKMAGCLLLVFVLFFTGCSTEHSSKKEKDGGKEQTEEVKDITISDAAEEKSEPVIEEMDWSAFFDGLNGCAVLYNPKEDKYRIFNQDMAMEQRSPCSTFKIISSLIGLEKGVIVPEDSTRKWSGEIFWNQDWNKDIDFTDAFHTSCVWYYREVIDEIGEEVMQDELDKLQYGNADISDWSGSMNTNNDNPVLTGFWIESSLKISPKEQIEVMERIFGDESVYSEESIQKLRDVMKVEEPMIEGIEVYGKTGMGKDKGVTVDAWFAGFAEIKGEREYFCVYLGESDNSEVTSAKAKEIAIEGIRHED